MLKKIIIGQEPAVLVHKGTIDGQLPKIGTEIADGDVSSGKVIWKDLDHGGVFAFNKRHLIVSEITGGAPVIVSNDNLATTTRPLPSLPFKLHPGEALKFSSGTEVSVTVQEDATRVI